MNLHGIASGNALSAKDEKFLKNLFRRVEYLEDYLGTSLDSPEGELYKEKEKEEKRKERKRKLKEKLSS